MEKPLDGGIAGVHGLDALVDCMDDRINLWMDKWGGVGGREGMGD